LKLYLFILETHVVTFKYMVEMVMFE